MTEHVHTLYLVLLALLSPTPFLACFSANYEVTPESFSVSEFLQTRQDYVVPPGTGLAFSSTATVDLCSAPSQRAPNFGFQYF